MTEDLRNLWDTRDTWVALDVFEPMKDRLGETLRHGGLHLTRREDSYYGDDAIGGTYMITTADRRRNNGRLMRNG